MFANLMAEETLQNKTPRSLAGVSHDEMAASLSGVRGRVRDFLSSIVVTVVEQVIGAVERMLVDCDEQVQMVASLEVGRATGSLAFQFAALEDCDQQMKEKIMPGRRPWSHTSALCEEMTGTWP